jgi:hypothetical protein
VDAEKRREASRSFSDTLRAKWAESRRGISAEDLMGTEQHTAPGGRNENHEDEEGDR